MSYNLTIRQSIVVLSSLLRRKEQAPLVISSLRLVNNFINLNDKTVTEQYRMQEPNELLSKLLAGEIARREPKIHWISMSIWLFQLQKMCMGLKNASFTMQRLIDRLLRGAHRFAGALLDHLIIYDNDFQLHLDHVRHF